MSIKDFYDSTAHRYDLRQGNPWTKHLRRFEEQLIRKHAHGRILDIGCGAGHHLAFMEKNNIGKELVGIDISPNMLKEAQKKCRCQLLEGSAEELPFPDNTFDAILCFHGTFNFLDDGKAVKEMARVLKKGGLALLSVTSIWDKDYPPFWKKMKTSSDNVIKTHRLENTRLRSNLFSRANLMKTFVDASFEPVSFGGLFIYQRPWWGRFDPLTASQRIKLSLDAIYPFSRLAEAGTIYLVAFRKPA